MLSKNHEDTKLWVKQKQKTMEFGAPNKDGRSSAGIFTTETANSEAQTLQTKWIWEIKYSNLFDYNLTSWKHPKSVGWNPPPLYLEFQAQFEAIYPKNAK